MSAESVLPYDIDSIISVREKKKNRPLPGTLARIMDRYKIEGEAYKAASLRCPNLQEGEYVYKVKIEEGNSKEIRECTRFDIRGVFDPKVDPKSGDTIIFRLKNLFGDTPLDGLVLKVGDVADRSLGEKDVPGCVVNGAGKDNENNLGIPSKKIGGTLIPNPDFVGLENPYEIGDILSVRRTTQNRPLPGTVATVIDRSRITGEAFTEAQEKFPDLQEGEYVYKVKIEEGNSKEIRECTRFDIRGVFDPKVDPKSGDTIIFRLKNLFGDTPLDGLVLKVGDVADRSLGEKDVPGCVVNGAGKDNENNLGIPSKKIGGTLIPNPDYIAVDQPSGPSQRTGIRQTCAAPHA